MTASNRGRLAAALTAALTVSTLTMTAPAQATYPGSNGRIVFGGFYDTEDGRAADLFSVQADGENLTRLTDDAAFDLCPAVSADGRRLATCRNEGAGYEIWTMDLDGTHPRQLTGLGGAALFPDWNPQGNRIVFQWAPSPDDNPGLYVVHAQSGRVTPLLVEPGFALSFPVYSPDGRNVLYLKQQFDSNGDPSYGQLWTLDVKSGRTTQLTSDEALKDQLPDWSPDGRRIVYNAITDGDDDIWIMNADGTGQKNLTAEAGATEVAPAFSPDGAWIAFTGTGGPVPDGERYIQVMRTDGTDRAVLVETPGYKHAAPAWQPTTHRP